MLIKTDLAHRLRQGEVDRLESDDLDAVLGWITRAQRQPAASLASILGDPGSDPVLLRRIYEQLDRILFLEGNLREDVAGVAETLAEDHRRARYRRLMAAFHPDRYPDARLAEWLTTRSQAVHRAYERFRRGDVPAAKPAVRVEPAAASAAPRAHKRRIPRFSFGPGFTDLIRARARGIRHLEAKILGALAVLFFLPVLIQYLNQYPVPAESVTESSPSSTTGPRTTAAELGASALDPRLSAPVGSHEPVVMFEGSPEGRDAATMRRPLDSPKPVVELLATKAESEGIAAREAIARLAAAREIAAIEAAAVATAARRMAEREDYVAASMSPGTAGTGGTGGAAGAGRLTSDEVIRRGGHDLGDEMRAPAWRQADHRHGDTGYEAAVRDLDGRVAATVTGTSTYVDDPSLASEESVLEAATREAALLESAARRAAEKEAEALEAALRETAALEHAMWEAAALQAAASQAAERENAAREAAAAAARASRAETPANPLVNEQTGDSRLSWVADHQREPGPTARRPNESEIATTDAEAMEIGRRRVTALLDSYQSAFRHGDIAGLMRHLGPDPRENNNRGRSWFEAGFRELLERSRWRQLRLDIVSIDPSSDGDWEVSGHFHLRVDYMDRPVVEASGPVQYRVSNRSGGWRIDRIDY